MQKPVWPDVPISNSERDKLRSVKPFVGVDHPLSQGRRVILLTACRWVEEEMRTPEALMDKLIGPWEGRCLRFDEDQRIYIMIGHQVSKVRFIELATHECSHAVDYFFETCDLERPCTELRAYYLDWIVGKLFHHVPFVMSDEAASAEAGYCTSRSAL